MTDVAVSKERAPISSARNLTETAVGAGSLIVLVDYLVKLYLPDVPPEVQAALTAIAIGGFTTSMSTLRDLGVGSFLTGASK